MSPLLKLDKHVLNVCYSPKYYADTHTNSMEKLTVVAETLHQCPKVRFHAPAPLDLDLLRQLHDPDYVNAFLTGHPPKLASMQGFKPWNEKLRDAILSINAGQICGAELAWKHGIAANIAQGFHHASYQFGGAYCTFNGLALVAQAFPDKKIFILDCDQHGGNGTAEFTLRLPNLFNFSIYGLAFGCPRYERAETRHIHKKTGSYDEYQQAIHEGIAAAKAWGADLIIYQAGMDCHQADPFGSTWFTTELIAEREKLVFNLTKAHNFPVLFVLAGGYQKLSNLLELHLSTFRAAYQAYYNDSLEFYLP